MADSRNSPILSDEENETWCSDSGSQWDGTNTKYHDRLRFVRLKRELLLHSCYASISSYSKKYDAQDQKLAEIEADLIGFLGLEAKKPASSAQVDLISDQLYRMSDQLQGVSEKLDFLSGQKHSKPGHNQQPGFEDSRYAGRGAHRSVYRCCRQCAVSYGQPPSVKAASYAASYNQQLCSCASMQPAVNYSRRPHNFAATQHAGCALQYWTPQFNGTFYPPMMHPPPPPFSSCVTPLYRGILPPAPALSPVPVFVFVQPCPWFAPPPLPFGPYQMYPRPGPQYLGLAF